MRTPQLLREELLAWSETVDYQGKDKSAIVASSLENLADVAVEDHARCFKATVLFLIEDDELYQQVGILEKLTNKELGLEALIMEGNEKYPYRAVLRDSDANETYTVVFTSSYFQAKEKAKAFLGKHID